MTFESQKGQYIHHITQGEGWCKPIIGFNEFEIDDSAALVQATEILIHPKKSEFDQNTKSKHM